MNDNDNDNDNEKEDEEIFDIKNLFQLDTDLEINLTKEQLQAIDKLVENSVKCGIWKGMLMYIDTIQENIIETILDEDIDPEETAEIVEETLHRDWHNAETNYDDAMTALDYSNVDLGMTFAKKPSDDSSIKDEKNE